MLHPLHNGNIKKCRIVLCHIIIKPLITGLSRLTDLDTTQTGQNVEPSGAAAAAAAMAARCAGIAGTTGRPTPGAGAKIIAGTGGSPLANRS